MTRCAVTVALSAVEDLERMREWYAGQGAEEAGVRLIAEVVARIERLADFPQSGRVVPEFGVESIREIVHPPVRIVYRLEPGRARVVRIWRSERLLRSP